MQRDARPGSTSQAMLGALSPSITAARHSHGSPRQAAQRRQPYIIPGREQSPQNELTLPELMQRRGQLLSVINSIEQGIQTILAQTGGFPGDAWTAKLGKMHADLHKHKTLLIGVNQAIQRTSNPNDMLGGNLAHLNTMASAAGPVGVIQDGGAPKKPWTQSASPTPSFGTNPGVSTPSTADLRSANPVSLDELLGIPSAPQGVFPSWVTTAGLSMVPTPQGPPSMMLNVTQSPQLTEKKPAIQSGPILPPTEEQLEHAVNVVQNLKRVFSTKPPTMQLHALSDNQRMEYNKLLEQLHEMTQDLDVKLPMYCIVLRSDNMIRNLVAIVSLVAHQRASRSTESRLVKIDLSALKSMRSLLQQAIDQFEQRHHTMDVSVAPQQMGDGLAALLASPPPIALNATPSTQLIPLIHIPDLTGLITRCNRDPVSGGTYGNIYRCIYHGPEGDVDVAVKAIRPQFFTDEVIFCSMVQKDLIQLS
ncbi:hypothetical protein DFH29DRAFT_580137 [Suillus ampliporus]|nr:hypothetical protein DFH29DRAFT_580137 [Suillus ampliporus]